MFYEFSIQYDDPIVLHLAKLSPISDALYFNVTHAYPNWIPSNYPLIDDKSRNEILSSEFLNLNYHRYIHLFHTFLPNDINIKSPHESFSSSIVRILSPLVPQGNWTNGGSPPQPSEFFYRSFPKQSPDFDNDYHSQNPGVFWGWFQLSRWLPNLIQKILFPLDDVVYNKDSSDDDNSNSGFTVNSTSLPPRARKLSGIEIPTKLECSLCEKFKGITIWDRNGNWFCIYDNKISEIGDIDDEDSYGLKYFKSFNSYIEWKRGFNKKLMKLERLAYLANNMNEMKNIEDQIIELNSIKNNERTVKSKFIVSVKG